VTKDLTPAANAIVKLIPPEFNPVDQASPDCNFTDITVSA